MKTRLILLAACAALTLQSLASVFLTPGASRNVFSEPDPTQMLASVAWLFPPDKQAALFNGRGQAQFAYIARWEDNAVVERMDDSFEVFDVWQESGNWPEDVWLYIGVANVLVPDGGTLVPTDRTERFAFVQDANVNPLIPEPRHVALLVGIGLLGMACYRWQR